MVRIRSFGDIKGIRRAAMDFLKPLFSLVILALCLTLPSSAKNNSWTEVDGKLGQTLEIKEFHFQPCQHRYDCWGLMDRSGRIKPCPIIRLIGVEDSGRIFARMPDEKNIYSVRKLIGPKGQIVPKTDKFEIVNLMVENRAPARSVSQYQAQTKEKVAFSYCTETGEILPGFFDQVSPFNEGVAAVRIGKTVGFIGMDGKFLAGSKKVECQFLKGVSQGCLACCVDGRWGYLDTQGNWFVKPVFESAEPFSSDFALVRPHNPNKKVPESGFISYIDKKGNLFEQRYHSGYPFEGGYAAAAVQSENRTSKLSWGLIDRSGQWVLKPTYSRIGALNGSTRLIYKKNLVGVFSNGKVTIPPIYPTIGDFSEGLASFQSPKSKSFGFLDPNGKIVIPAQFAFAGTFSEGLAAVRISTKSGGGIGFVDKQGIIRISPKYGDPDYPSPEFNRDFVQFHDGICLIPERPYHSGQYPKIGSGFIDKSGQWISDKIITVAYPFKSGQSLVRYFPNSAK